MPLMKSSAKSAVSQNIRQLRKDDYPQKQAIAIALDIQRRARDGKYQAGGEILRLFSKLPYAKSPRSILEQMSPYRNYGYPRGLVPSTDPEVAKYLGSLPEVTGGSYLPHHVLRDTISAGPSRRAAEIERQYETVTKLLRDAQEEFAYGNVSKDRVDTLTRMQENLTRLRNGQSPSTYPYNLRVKEGANFLPWEEPLAQGSPIQRHILGHPAATDANRAAVISPNATGESALLQLERNRALRPEQRPWEVLNNLGYAGVKLPKHPINPEASTFSITNPEYISEFSPAVRAYGGGVGYLAGGGVKQFDPFLYGDDSEQAQLVSGRWMPWRGRGFRDFLPPPKATPEVGVPQQVPKYRGDDVTLKYKFNGWNSLTPEEQNTIRLYEGWKNDVDPQAWYLKKQMELPQAPAEVKPATPSDDLLSHIRESYRKGWPNRAYGGGVGYQTGGAVARVLAILGAMGAIKHNKYQPFLDRTRQGWDEAGFSGLSDDGDSNANRGQSGRGTPVKDSYAFGGRSPYGFINGGTPGRADAVPASVKPRSYVIPADIVSGLGQGNSMAGAHALDRMLKQGPAYGVKMHPAMRTPQPMPKFTRGFAQGGDVDISVSHGEYLVRPETVAALGNGDIDFGHKILDALVKNARQDTIARLSNLPPPKGSDESQQQFDNGGMTHEGYQPSTMDRISAGLRRYMDMMSQRKTTYQAGGQTASLEEPNEQDVMDKSLIPPLPDQTGSVMDWIRAKNEAARGVGVTREYALSRLIGMRGPPRLANRYAIGGGNIGLPLDDMQNDGEETPQQAQLGILRGVRTSPPRIQDLLGKYNEYVKGLPEPQLRNIQDAIENLRRSEQGFRDFGASVAYGKHSAPRYGVDPEALHYFETGRQIPWNWKNPIVQPGKRIPMPDIVNHPILSDPYHSWMADTGAIFHPPNLNATSWRNIGGGGRGVDKWDVPVFTKPGEATGSGGQKIRYPTGYNEENMGRTFNFYLPNGYSSGSPLRASPELQADIASSLVSSGFTRGNGLPRSNNEVVQELRKALTQMYLSNRKHSGTSPLASQDISHRPMSMLGPNFPLGYTKRFSEIPRVNAADHIVDYPEGTIALTRIGDYLRAGGQKPEAEIRDFIRRYRTGVENPTVQSELFNR